MSDCLLSTFIFILKHVIFSSDDSEIDEIVTLIRGKKTIKSQHDLNSYTSFILKDLSLAGMNKLLLSEEILEEDISNSVPWHVNDSCVIVVDLNKLEDRENITYDCWSWKNDKSYIIG